MAKSPLDDQMDQYQDDPNNDPFSNKPTTQPAGTAPGPTSTSTSTPGAGYDYQKFQSGWYNSAPGTSLDKFIADHPDYTQGATTSKGGEYLNLPGGQSFDAVRDMGGASAPQWGDQGHDYATGRALSPQESAAAEAQWAAAHGGTSSAAGGAAGGGGLSMSSSSSTGSQDPAVHDAIMRLLARGEKPVDEASMASQFDPVARQFDRGAQHTREQAAERLAGQGMNQGGSGGSLDTEVNSINEKNTEAKGGLMAQLVTQELQGRRGDVVNALQLAQGEEKNQLTLELANLDQQIKQASLGLQAQAQSQQNSQFYDEFGYRAAKDKAVFDQTYGQGLGA